MRERSRRQAGCKAAAGARLAGLSAVVVLACALAIGGPASAGPALLVDAGNGRVLYAEDQDDQWYPASLTKIMTAYLAFDALKAGRLAPEQKIAVSEKAHLQAPSKVGLPVGAEMTVDLAVKALIVKSANDVAMMLAEAIGGSEEGFVKLMNDTARRLGMTRTTFVNPNGLPAPEQVTTARDLARLSVAVLRDFPDQAPLWQMTEVRIGKQRLGSHNHLLQRFEGADGLKTGFICDSGFNLVASATRDNRRLLAVVLGDTSSHDRNIRAMSMLDHGFQMQGWKQLLGIGATTLDTLPMPATPKPVQSIRQTVSGWDCGSRRRPVAKRKGPATVAAGKDGARAKAGTAKSVAAGTGATPRQKATAKAQAQ